MRDHQDMIRDATRLQTLEAARDFATKYAEAEFFWDRFKLRVDDMTAGACLGHPEFRGLLNTQLAKIDEIVVADTIKEMDREIAELRARWGLGTDDAGAGDPAGVLPDGEPLDPDAGPYD